MARKFDVDCYEIKQLDLEECNNPHDLIPAFNERFSGSYSLFFWHHCANDLKRLVTICAVKSKTDVSDGGIGLSHEEERNMYEFVLGFLAARRKDK